MNNNTMKLLFFIFFSALLIAPCYGETKLDPSERLLGSWELVEGEPVGLKLRFLDDGTYTVNDTKAGKWNILDDGTLKLELFDESGDTEVLEMEFVGNQLMITHIDIGETDVFNRLAPCSGETSFDPSERLLGSWELVEGEDVGLKLRFLDDGTYTVNGNKAGKWNILDDGTLKTEVTYWGFPSLYEMEFVGNQLITTNINDGKTDVFNRLE